MFNHNSMVDSDKLSHKFKGKSKIVFINGKMVWEIVNINEVSYMLNIMLGLLAISVLTILLSFFLKDPYKTLREEIDQLSLQQAQDIYQLKKKITILEEELLMDDFHQPVSYKDSSVSQTVVHDIIKSQVFALAQQGKTIDQIAQQSSLSPESVLRILNENRGSQYE